MKKQYELFEECNFIFFRKLPLCLYLIMPYLLSGKIVLHFFYTSYLKCFNDNNNVFILKQKVIFINHN